MRKKVCVGLILGLLPFFLTACAKKTMSSSKVDQSVVTITAGKQSDENYGRYAAGEDINHNPMIQEGINQLGIKIQYNILGNNYDDYVNQLRLALTGAEVLPDVIPVYDQGLMAEMIESGQVKAIDEDLALYLPERLRVVYQNFPESFYSAKKGDKTYGLPITPSLAETQVLVIRQDWLDKLNLKAPTTLAEFEVVIKAFAEEDPDGNGKKDTYGFSYSGDGLYSTGWLGDPAMLFSANTGKFIPGNWEENGEGELIYGSIQPGNKKTLEKMATWYQKGWIASDASVTNDWNAMLAFRDGKAGMYVGRPAHIEDSIEVESKILGAKIGVYPTIRQDNGEPTYQRAEENDGWLLFKKDFNGMEAFFKYYDWLYDAAFGTGDFKYGYLENYDYDIVKKKPVFDPTTFDPPQTRWLFNPSKAILTKNMPALDQMLPYHKAVTGDLATNGTEMKLQQLYHTDLKPLVVAGNIAYQNQEQLTANKFRGQLSDTLQDLFYRFQTKENQVFSDIISGKSDSSAFDAFVSDWEQNGGADITAAVNDWYLQTSEVKTSEANH